MQYASLTSADVGLGLPKEEPTPSAGLIGLLLAHCTPGIALGSFCLNAILLLVCLTLKVLIMTIDALGHF